MWGPLEDFAGVQWGISSCHPGCGDGSGGNRLPLAVLLGLASPGGGDRAVLRASPLHLKAGSSFPSLNCPLEKPQDGHRWRQRKPWFQPGLLVPGLVWRLDARALCSWTVWELPVRPLSGRGRKRARVPYSDRCPPVVQAGRGCLSPRGHLASWVHTHCPPPASPHP